MNKNLKVLITGSRGTLGSEIKRQCRKAKINYLSLDSKKIDITDYKSLDFFFKKKKPNYIIHTASKVYGIGGNSDCNFEMLNENLLINANLFKVCKKYNIKKIICIGSSAVYSDKYKKNIEEKNIFNLNPHYSEFYYGLSKRMMLQQLMSLSKETKIKFCYIVMNNLYGINDNFNIHNGHVIPSLIHKFYLAKKSKHNVKLWGSPKTKRCFLFTKDAARIILNLLNKNIKIINVSGKTEISIGNLSKLIARIYNFKGKIIWQHKIHKGVNRRHLSTKFLNKLKIEENYSLEEGLKETIKWFISNYTSKNIRK